MRFRWCIMARSRRKPKKVPFPPKKWLPGQAPRIEKPKKGAGYDRTRERRRKDEAAEDM
jgi:hypothetical protein